MIVNVSKADGCLNWMLALSSDGSESLLRGFSPLVNKLLTMLYIPPMHSTTLVAVELPKRGCILNDCIPNLVNIVDYECDKRENMYIYIYIYHILIFFYSFTCTRVHHGLHAMCYHYICP